MGKVSTFEEKNIWKVLFKVAPPVMLAQLILAMYNIVDSYFVGKYSGRRIDRTFRNISDSAYYNRCSCRYGSRRKYKYVGLLCAEQRGKSA